MEDVFESFTIAASRGRISAAPPASRRRVAGHAHDLAKLLADGAFGGFDVVAVLQIEPELRRGAERAAQAQSGVGGDAAGLSGDAFDPRARHAHRLGQRAGRQSERHEKFLAQDFAGVERGKFLGHGDGAILNESVIAQLGNSDCCLAINSMNFFELVNPKFQNVFCVMA